MSIVTVNVSTDSAAIGSERRFEKGLSIAQLKGKLEMITGVPAAHQRIELLGLNDEQLGTMQPDDALLGAFPVDSGMRLHVINTDPFKVAGEFDDVSKVEKFEITHDEYAERTDTVMAFKKRNKIGRFNPEVAAQMEQRQVEAEHEGEEKAKEIKVGDRCQVTVVGSGQPRLGAVRYVGKTKFRPGYWVGVQYDEPVGKNNGTVQGDQYFECPDKYGGFVRPATVTCGDFPEEDYGLSSDDEM